MKRTITSIFAIVLALVMVLSLAACGNSEKDLKEEQEAVNKALQGGWSNRDYMNESYYEGELLAVYVFLDGEYSFDNIQVKTKETWHSEEGTYTINAQKKEINCTANEEVLGSKMERTLTYEYKDGNLKLLDEKGKSLDKYEK